MQFEATVIRWYCPRLIVSHKEDTETCIGGNGQSKEIIRNYFLNDFYKDHCKIYQKRPIYWLFYSGKKNGFKALIYMHRYQPDGERVKLNKALSYLKDQDIELRIYEGKIHHLADQMIAIDLDDGVKVNYEKLQDVLAKIK